MAMPSRVAVDADSARKQPRHGLLFRPRQPRIGESARRCRCAFFLCGLKGSTHQIDAIDLRLVQVGSSANSHFNLTESFKNGRVVLAAQEDRIDLVGYD